MPPAAAQEYMDVRPFATAPRKDVGDAEPVKGTGKSDDDALPRLFVYVEDDLER